ncbi:MAG: ribonuclease Z, partial [Bacteroidota bacterium]
KNMFNSGKLNFISHLHGDHYFGLIGLVSTFQLLTRETELHIYGPKGIKEVITLQLKLSESWTSYPLIFHELTSKESEKLYEDDKVEVHTIPLKHRVYTNGFLFKEKENERKLDISAVLNANINVAYYRKLKQGADVENEDGILVKNASVTKDPLPSKSYAYCSDTVYYEAIIPIIKDATVLYHESTFLDKNEALCERTKHSTARQAGKIARKANVETLLLGHFSTRYNGYDVFESEAREEFDNVLLAQDGKSFEF